jgi:FixJ family two-component response regulator
MIVCRTTEETSRDSVNPFLYIFPGQNKSKGKRDFTVSIVGDDPRLLTGLARLVEGAGYPVQGFSSAADFLGQHETNIPGCVIIDLQSPDLDGLELQATLAREELQLPVIFISGINDILASVRVMKAGALDVLPKPVDGRSLLSAIALAAERYAQLRREYEKRIAIRRKFAALSARESEVLRHVIAGRLNKQIAFELHVVEKTIKVHRGRVAKKLGTRSVVDLVRLASTAGVTPYFSDNS